MLLFANSMDQTDYPLLKGFLPSHLGQCWANGELHLRTSLWHRSSLCTFNCFVWLSSFIQCEIVTIISRWLQTHTAPSRFYYKPQIHSVSVDNWKSYPPTIKRLEHPHRKAKKSNIGLFFCSAAWSRQHVTHKVCPSLIKGGALLKNLYSEYLFVMPLVCFELWGVYKNQWINVLNKQAFFSVSCPSLQVYI